MIRKLTLLGAFVGLFAAGAQAQSRPPATGLSITIDTAALQMTVSVSGPDSLWERLEYQVRELGTASWKRARSTETNLLVNIASNLAPATTYELRVRAACSITPPFEISPFFGPDTFSTPDAPGVTPRLAEVSDVTLSLFPNPVANELSVRFTASAEGPASIEVLDLTGRTVLRSEQVALQGANAWTMDLSGLELGNYFVRVTDGAVEHVQPIQVAR